MTENYTLSAPWADQWGYKMSQLSLSVIDNLAFLRHEWRQQMITQVIEIILSATLLGELNNQMRVA